VNYRQAVRFRRRRYEKAGKLAAALMLGGEHAPHLPSALDMFGCRFDEVEYCKRVSKRSHSAARPFPEPCADPGRVGWSQRKELNRSVQVEPRD
jgi:hypothetical protein